MNISITAIEEAKAAYLHQSGKRPYILCVHTDEFRDLLAQLGITVVNRSLQICGLEIWPYNPEPGRWNVVHRAGQKSEEYRL
jgi:hypothetical protein